MALTSDPAARSSANSRKKINLALQGGGAHGAFGWGVMDKFLEDGRIEIEGISGTSAGSMNAVVYAYGKLKGDDGARQSLHDFWKAISDSGQRFQMPKLPWDMGLHAENPFQTLAKSMMAMFSPYQLNPLNYNPLREVLERQVDFEELNKHQHMTKLFICATNVRTGKVKIFDTKQVSPDVILASACLPQVFQAVEIDGEHYWDGGYMGNPVLYPLFYYTDSRDVVIVHINPIERPAPPRAAADIANRLNEITFNSSLIKELRAVAFVQKLLDDGWIKEPAQICLDSLGARRSGDVGSELGQQDEQRLAFSNDAARPRPRVGRTMAQGKLRSPRRTLLGGPEKGISVTAEMRI